MAFWHHMGTCLSGSLSNSHLIGRNALFHLPRPLQCVQVINPVNNQKGRAVPCPFQKVDSIWDGTLTPGDDQHVIRPPLQGKPVILAGSHMHSHDFVRLMLVVTWHGK